MIELVSTNQLGIVDYSIVLQLNNSASDSVCLNEFHVVSYKLHPKSCLSPHFGYTFWEYT